jgi:SNARE-complex protein Syntaxin-18 N-terminus
MVADVTGLFRRIVHELEQRVDPDKPDAVPDKNRILKTSKPAKDPFEAKALSIVDNIFRLRQFLSANRDAYVDVVLNRDHSINGLSDLERDRIDNGDLSDPSLICMVMYSD